MICANAVIYKGEGGLVWKCIPRYGILCCEEMCHGTFRGEGGLGN